VVALKKAGQPVVAAASSRVPHRSGRLASSLTTSVRGTTAEVISRAPYAGGAEWGRRGKWSGFRGSPPRYVWPAVESRGEQIRATLDAELRQLIEIQGWAT
jgi:phage gpG-like protein